MCNTTLLVILECFYIGLWQTQLLITPRLVPCLSYAANAPLIYKVQPPVSLNDMGLDESMQVLQYET